MDNKFSNDQTAVLWVETADWAILQRLLLHPQQRHICCKD